MNGKTISMLHPQLSGEGFAPLFGGQFPAEMLANVGKRVRYIKPSCLVEERDFTIGGVQRDYRGVFCYRVYWDGDDFGRVAQLDQIEFI